MCITERFNVLRTVLCVALMNNYGQLILVKICMVKCGGKCNMSGSGEPVKKGGGTSNKFH